MLVTDRRGLADDGRRGARQAGPRDPHTDRIRDRAGRPAVGIVLVDDLEQGAGRRRRLRRRAPRDPHRGRGRGRRAGPQRRRDLRRPLRAGLAGRLLRRLQPCAADRRLRAATPPDCPSAPSCKAVHVVDYDRDALAEVAAHVVTLAGAEDLAGPRRGRRASGSAPADDRPAGAAPAREDLRGLQPYGAPQLDVPVRLNVNENPYPPTAAVEADIERPPRRPRGSSTVTPTASSSPCARTLAAYLGSRHHAGAGLGRERLQRGDAPLLQAFGGPGRRALSFAPTYSMYPEYARDTHTGWDAGQREADFTLDPDRAVALVRAQRPDVVFLPSPNNPTGTAARASRSSPRSARRPRRAARRRRGVRRVPPRRDAERARAAADATPGSSSPGP